MLINNLLVKKVLLLLVGISSINVGFSQEKKSILFEAELELETEYRFFFNEALFANQARHFPSAAIKPEFSLEWDEGDQGISFEGFLRVDRDKSRTHYDIRDFYYLWAKSDFEFSVGLKKVFWGVTESVHLVDIINQTDQVESFDGEQKLGQPMVQFSWSSFRLGTFELYYMPYHRKRTFSGEMGRFRFPVVIDENDLGYESDKGKWRQDLAIRWKHYFGIFDIGLSHFYGTGREPLFVFEDNGAINAFYPVINQSGIDLQITHNAFLWKLESIYRNSKNQDFFAFGLGLEYTFSNVNNKGLDIGLISEYLYDERDDLALSTMQNELFIGSRIAFNDTDDTSFLIGGVFDLAKSSKVFALEASKRFGNSITVELEIRLFSNIDNEDLLLSNFKNDSFIGISISRYW